MRLGTYCRYLVSQKLNLPLSGNKILDIGCYDGFLLSQINAKEKIGIDLNIVMKYDNIQYIEDDFLEFDFNFKSEKPNRILAFDVMEHIARDEEFLKKLIDLLCLDGIATLSVPSKKIKVFPSFLQRWVDKKWGHLYRAGYTTEELSLKLSVQKRDVNIETHIIRYHCPFFRFFFFPLSLLWRVAPSLTKKVLREIVNLDSRHGDGENGFFFVLIYKKLESANELFI